MLPGLLSEERKSFVGYDVKLFTRFMYLYWEREIAEATRNYLEYRCYFWFDFIVAPSNDGRE